MPTQIDNQPSVQGNPNVGHNNPGVGFQISAGAAGLASSILYEIMGKYSLIMQYDEEQKVNMVKAQAAAAQSSAAATRAAGWTSLGMYLGMGLLSLGGAAAGAIGAAKINTSEEGKAASADFKAAEEKVTALKEPTAALKAANDPKAVGGNQALDAAEQQKINERVAELRGQDFKDVKNDDLTVKALKKMKADDNALFEQKKLQLNKDIDGGRLEMNSAVTRNNSLQQRLTGFDGKVKLFEQAANSATQGVGASVKAGYDADASLSQTSTQMAGSAAGDMGQAQNKAYDLQSAQVQILDKIIDSAK